MHSEYLQNVALWHCALTPLGFPSGTMVKKIHLPMQETQETWLGSLGWKDPLE